MTRHTSTLYVSRILAWADAYHRRTGRWPTVDSGRITEPLEALGENWRNTIDAALRRGFRGLPGGYSLAQLLADRRGVRNPADLSPLTVSQILSWADAHQSRTGKWPTVKSGRVREAPGETWLGLEHALNRGHRGLPAGLSLARLLAKHRGVRKQYNLPRLSYKLILSWADAHHKRTGMWPNVASGPVLDAPGESWANIHAALCDGTRGLRRGNTLAGLLAKYRGVGKHWRRPPLTTDQVLAWADAHHARTGRWPTRRSGRIRGAPGETWLGIDTALRVGSRGLHAGSSLVQFLAQHRAARNHMHLRPLSIRTIRRWADAYYRRTGHWPKRDSGPIDEAPGETWMAVEMALYKGRRGFPGGSSLFRVLGMPSVPKTKR